MPPSTSYFPLCPISCCSKSPKKKLTQNGEISIRINNKESLTVPTLEPSINKKLSKKIVYSRAASPTFPSPAATVPSSSTRIDIDDDEEFSTARVYNQQNSSQIQHLSMKDLMYKVRLEEGLTSRSTRSETDGTTSQTIERLQSLNSSEHVRTSNIRSHKSSSNSRSAVTQETDISISVIEHPKNTRKAAVFNEHGDISARTVSETNTPNIKRSRRESPMPEELPSFQLSLPAPPPSTVVRRYILSSPQMVVALVSVAYSWFISFFQILGKKPTSP